MTDKTPTEGGEDIPEFVPAYQERNNAIADIAKRVDAAVQEELHEFDEDTGELGKPVLEKKEVKAPEDEPNEPDEPQEPEAKVEAPAIRMVDITVDGRHMQVPEDKIIEAGKRTLQKESAADRRLQEAVTKERQAQAMLERAERLSRGDASTEPAPSQDAPQQTQDIRSVVKIELYNAESEKALAKFKQEFPEIISDPILSRLAAQLEDDRMAQAAAFGEPLSDPVEAYRKHGESIRARLGKMAAPAETSAAKIEKKRAMTVAPAANARAPQPVEKKPLSVSEQIEAMRTARSRGHQPNL